MWKTLDRIATTIITSPGTAVFAFLAGWLVCGSILDLAIRRIRYGRAIRVISFAGAFAVACVAGWFGWARYRLWHSDEWTDPPQSFPYPDALLLQWCEALTVPPPPGALDIHAGLYDVDFRLFVIIAVGWFVVGALAGAAIPPQRIFAGVSRRLRSSARGGAPRPSDRI